MSIQYVYCAVILTPLKSTTFRLETEIMEALAKIRDRDGIPVSEQVRRALREWTEAKGVKVKAARPSRGKRGDRT